MKISKTRLPKVSFIVPTLNAAFILERCLKAIRSQNYPQEKVEIIVADAGSKDKTLAIAKKYKAKIIKNPEILHEQGKAIASKQAKGKVFFFTDADNILSNPNWISAMVIPYLKYPKIVGFMPQTIPAPDSNSLDRYLGYLSTDPFTWFTYRWASSPRTYGNHYHPIKKTKDYIIYKFNVKQHPLFGLSQGFGTLSTFKRKGMGHSDDILAGIKIISEGGLIVYVPSAGVYHYHVSGINNFIKKYTWRIINNLTQKVKGMGLVNRKKYFNSERKLRQFLFIPYSLSIIFPILDTIYLLWLYKDPVILLHPIMCFLLSIIILKEYILFLLGLHNKLGTYGA